ncbi:MAG: lipocalin family protein [Deltaproteobacteria bacterium]|nr:lipocalin family protein [Deltaproteobacteria bacterium]
MLLRWWLDGRRYLRVFCVSLALLASACSTTTTKRLGLPPLRTVPRVDLSRYIGTWYEIASYPHRFQRGCTATTASYTLRSDGQIEVVNRCRKGALDGKEDSAKGRARVVDKQTNAKLEVTFFWPFWGDYWIIDLGKNYEYAVVGHPGRDYLWILSRTPTLDQSLYQGILQRLRANSYPLERLKKTLQPTDPPSAVPVTAAAGQ